MARLLNMTMLLLIGVGLLVAGCGSDDDGNGDDGNGDDAKGGGTSRGSGASTRADAGATAANAVVEALKSFKAAMLSGDKNAIAGCIEGSDKHIEFFAATSDVLAVISRYQDAMQAAYGDDVIRGGGRRPFDIEGVEIKIDGDTAVAAKPGSDDVMKLVKKGGLWKIDANAMMPEEKLEQASQTMGMMKAMAEAQKGVMGKIGKEGYSAEKINEEVNKAMAEARALSTRPGPPRPDPGRGNDGDNGAGAPIANTPMQALKDLQAAMLSGDKDAIANCMDGFDKHTKFFAALSESLVVGTRFRNAMKAAYGNDAVRGGNTNPFSLEGIEIKIDDDTAVATQSGSNELVKLVKKGGQWKIDANSIMSEEKVDKALKSIPQMKAMMEAQRGLMGKIGQPGYSAEKINQELLKAMRSSMPAPVPTPPTPPTPAPE